MLQSKSPGTVQAFFVCSGLQYLQRYYAMCCTFVRKKYVVVADCLLSIMQSLDDDGTASVDNVAAVKVLATV